jgi:hypothetical protein
VRNHPFIDGNKRDGFLLAYVFLVQPADIATFDPPAAAARRQPKSRPPLLHTGGDIGAASP